MKPLAVGVPQKILLIRLKGIGDVILSTPLVRALRKAFPQAEIHFLTRALCAPILKHNPNIDKVLIHPVKSASAFEMFRFLGSLRSARYDWVLDLAAEPRSAWLTLATGAPLRGGYAFRIRKWAFNFAIPKNQVRKYQAEVNLDIIRAVGVPSDGFQTEIFLENGEKDWAGKQWEGPEFAGQKFKIGFNPTGTWPSKRWPVDYWRRLAALVYGQLGVKPILCGGPGDEGILEEIRWGIEDKVLEMPKAGLLEASAFISQMDLLIGNDGTPQHIAQAFGTKSLTLCGPHWGLSWTKPGDARHRFLQHFLDCGPCDLNACPFPRQEGQARHVHQECLLKITPKKVFGTAFEMLGTTTV